MSTKSRIKVLEAKILFLKTTLNDVITVLKIVDNHTPPQIDIQGTIDKCRETLAATAKTYEGEG